MSDGKRSAFSIDIEADASVSSNLNARDLAAAELEAMRRWAQMDDMERATATLLVKDTLVHLLLNLDQWVPTAFTGREERLTLTIHMMTSHMRDRVSEHRVQHERELALARQIIIDAAND